VSAAKSVADARATSEGALRGRSQTDVARAITTSATTLLQVYSAQPADVAAHALNCFQKPAD
jgi:hypothetical protein